jgi:sugar phosphate isomerase/epimerase
MKPVRDGQVSRPCRFAEEEGVAILELCSGTILQAPGLAAKVDAAHRAGFGAISIWYQDYAGARADGMSDRAIRQLLADHGLVVNETEVLARWVPTDGVATVDASGVREQLSMKERDLLSMTAAVGARSVTAVELLGASVDLDAASEAFAGLCDRAAEFGVDVNLEFMPFSGIPDLAAALRVVTGAGRPNGGLVIDAWHVFRSNTPLATLDAVPPERVHVVQLSDAPAAAPADIRTETGTARLLPGKGDIDLVGIVRRLDALGVDVPFGVEVFSRELMSRDPADVAVLAMESLRRVLDEARQPSQATG